MKGISRILTFSLICIPIVLRSQVPDLSNDLRHLETIMSDFNYREYQSNRYLEFEGSPYMQEEFFQGAISASKKKYENLLLRFNYYEGYFEFKENDEIKYIDPIQSNIDTVWLNEHIFVPVNYFIGNALKKSFMELLKTGSTKVYLRKFIVLLEPQEAKGYADAKPARFSQGPEEIYIQTGDGAAIEFKGKKSIPEIFQDHSNELENYSKKNKLKSKDPDDIIKLCIYYDELVNSSKP